MSTRSSGINKWMALISITLAYTYTFISRYVWSPLMTDVSAEFALNSTQGGLYMSAFFIGYIIMQVPGGILADKFEPKYILSAASLIVGIATALMSQVTFFSLGIWFRVVAGLASGLMMSCCSKVISQAFNVKERSVALGVLMASPPFGITIANLIGPLLNNSLGWRSTFLVVGAFSLLISALLILFVAKKDPPSSDGEEQATRKFSFIEGLFAFLRNPNQLLLVVAGFMFMFTTTGFPTWVNRFTAALGFSQPQTMSIAMLYSLAGVAGSVAAGLLPRILRMDHRRFLLLALSGMAILSIALVVRWPFLLFLAISIVYGFISYLPASHFIVMAIDLSEPQYSATSVASQNLFFQTASVIQPIVLGWGIDTSGGFSILWYAFAVAMLIAFLATKRTKT